MQIQPRNRVPRSQQHRQLQLCVPLVDRRWALRPGRPVQALLQIAWYLTQLDLPDRDEAARRGRCHWPGPVAAANRKTVAPGTLSAGPAQANRKRPPRPAPMRAAAQQISKNVARCAWRQASPADLRQPSLNASALFFASVNRAAVLTAVEAGKWRGVRPGRRHVCDAVGARGVSMALGATDRNCRLLPLARGPDSLGPVVPPDGRPMLEGVVSGGI
jgi:hypothetical protein